MCSEDIGMTFAHSKAVEVLVMEVELLTVVAHDLTRVMDSEVA